MSGFAIDAIASEAKRSELARELPIAVKECTIVEKKLSITRKRSVIGIWFLEVKLCFHPLNRFPEGPDTTHPNAFTTIMSLELS